MHLNIYIYIYIYIYIVNISPYQKLMPAQAIVCGTSWCHGYFKDVLTQLSILQLPTCPTACPPPSLVKKW